MMGDDGKGDDLARGWAGGLASLFAIARTPGVAEWVEGNLVIPRKMSPVGHGRVNLELKPFMRWILECWRPGSGVRSCAVAGAAQLFKTTTLVLGLAYRMRFEPVPVLVMGPSRDWVKREIGGRRLHPLIEGNEVLRELMPVDAEKFRLLHMEMKGGDVVLCGANSDSELAGGTFGIVAVEEAAKITRQNSEDAQEGHPIDLAFERVNAFGSAGFRWLSSTPNSPLHPFWGWVTEGDLTLPGVRCPHCKQWFSFEVEVDESRGYRSLVCDAGARGVDGLWDKGKVLETTRYICPVNGCVIGNDMKLGMLRGMEQRRTNAGAPGDARSFRVNFLHDPFLSFGEALWMFFEAQGDLFGLQNFYNSKLSLPWEEMECNVKEGQVEALKGGYVRGVIPFAPKTLVVTADPGEKQTHWEVVAVGGDGTLAVVDWGTVLHWDNLFDSEWVGKRAYAVAGEPGKVLRPRAGFIDSGDWTEEVYKFCRRSAGGGASGWRWFPTKGSNATHGTWAVTTPPRYDEMELFTYVDHQAKLDLYLGRVALRRSPGLLLPGDADGALIQGHAGQQLVKTKEGRRWKKVPGDHYGDCTKLGLVASWVLAAG